MDKFADFLSTSKGKYISLGVVLLIVVAIIIPFVPLSAFKTFLRSPSTNQKADTATSSTTTGKTVEKIGDDSTLSVVYKDMFNWTGWTNIPGHKEISERGSKLKLYSNPASNWTRAVTENPSSWLTVNGDFDVLFILTLGETQTSKNPVTRINFYNLTSPGDLTYDKAYIRVDNNSNLIFETYDRKTDQTVRLGSGKFPKSGIIRLAVRNIEGQTEEIRVLDGGTNQEITRAKLHFKFFRPGRKLSFSFEIGGGLKSITISDFRIIAPANSSNIVRG